MAHAKSQNVGDVGVAEVPDQVTPRRRKTSIPFTYNEAVVYAEMLGKLTGQTVGAQEDKHGQWGVTIARQVVVTKRLTTLNAVHKMMQKLQESALPLDEEETPPE